MWFKKKKSVVEKIDVKQETAFLVLTDNTTTTVFVRGYMFDNEYIVEANVADYLRSVKEFFLDISGKYIAKSMIKSFTVVSEPYIIEVVK